MQNVGDKIDQIGDHRPDKVQRYVQDFVRLSEAYNNNTYHGAQEVDVQKWHVNQARHSEERETYITMHVQSQHARHVLPPAGQCVPRAREATVPHRQQKVCAKARTQVGKKAGMRGEEAIG